LIAACSIAALSQGNGPSQSDTISVPLCRQWRQPTKAIHRWSFFDGLPRRSRPKRATRMPCALHASPTHLGNADIVFAAPSGDVEATLTEDRAVTEALCRRALRYSCIAEWRPDTDEVTIHWAEVERVAADAADPNTGMARILLAAREAGRIGAGSP
jgi:hypothetical protein